MNILRYTVLSFSLFIFFSFSQNSFPRNTPVRALNNYVQFANECIHGMLIVHRLLEGFNQEVNKYVDLQSNQLNFYANKDLPKNIFLDEENWFYEVTPYEWYTKAKAEAKNLRPAEATRLNGHLEKLRVMIDRANAFRFELENFIATKDLQNEANQTEVFRMLEACSNLYENFYTEKEALRKSIVSIYKKNYSKGDKEDKDITTLRGIQEDILPILKSIRYEVEGNLPDQTKQLQTKVNQLKSIRISDPRQKMVKDAAKDFLANLKKYQSSAAFDSKYQLYGRAYFFHNVELVAAFNNYSGRLVRIANELILKKSPNGILLFEEPHIFKVIYPKKEIERPESEEIIAEIPEAINDRNVVVRQQSIVVDKEEFTLQLFDHKEVDGDIISINLNGKWIIEQQELKRNPFKFKVKLNPKGENYIVLHAENLGKTPPNTAALVYYFQGKRKQVVLNSNLNESEMIRFERVK